MTISEQISDVFTGFYDGTVISCEAIENGYRFTIDCLYIAKRLNPEFEVFYVDIFDVALISFDPWLSEEEKKNFKVTFEQAFLYEPEIAVSDEKNDEITIILRIDYIDVPYPGAEVTFKAKDISMYDQENKKLDLADFFGLVSSYWDSFGKK